MSDAQHLAKVFASPGRYIQGPHALAALPDVIDRLGVRRPVLIRDATVAKILAHRLEGFDASAMVDFNGECSPEEIARIGEIVDGQAFDGVVGLGGGKALDTAKAVAHQRRLPLVIAPTTAATDGPTSALSVVYDTSGMFLRYEFHGRHPDVVLVDTAVIAEAPVRFLVSGMGDALATFYESRSSGLTARRTMVDGAPTRTALALGELCQDLLYRYGILARQAAAESAVTPALECVVEANTLLSGLGFESGGVAAAHAIHNGLTALPDTHAYWHGEKVAFGLCAMMHLEGQPPAVAEEVTDFCIRVGLPVTLAEVGLANPDRAQLAAVAARACAPGETIYNEPFPVFPEDVAHAMAAADHFGRARTELLSRREALPAKLA